jgi:hypothetical protein
VKELSDIQATVLQTRNIGAAIATMIATMQETLNPVEKRESTKSHTEDETLESLSDSSELM